jgi:hypothetical protein
MSTPKKRKTKEEKLNDKNEKFEFLKDADRICKGDQQVPTIFKKGMELNMKTKMELCIIACWVINIFLNI